MHDTAQEGASTPESQLKTASRYFIGDSLPHKWASVYSYRPQSPDIFATKGEIFAVISLSASKGFNSTTAGNLLIDHFHEVYFESKKELVTDALSQAISAAGERLSQLLDHEEDVAAAGVDLNIATIVIRGDEIYFASLGNNRILLLPSLAAPEYIDIGQALRDPFGKGQIKIGSSFARTEHTLIVATASTIQDLGQQKTYELLREFDDSDLKQFNYKHPEEIAILMLGINLSDQRFEHVTTVINPEVGANLDADSIAEQDLPRAESFESGHVELSPLEPGITAGGDYRMEALIPNSPETTPEARFTPDLEAVTDLDTIPKPTFAERFQTLKLNLAKRLELLKKSRQIKTLQTQRSQAAGAPQGAESTEFTGNVLDKDKQANQSTWQHLLENSKKRLSTWRDYILYDLLKVNQKKSFGLEKGTDGQKYLVIFGFSVSFKILAVVGVIVGIILILNIVNGIGERQNRERAILRAVEQLDFIKANVTRLESDPILNPKSTQDIPAREKFITEVSALEERFTPELNALPTKEVEDQKGKLSELRQKALKVKTLQASIVLDVANVHQGAITDLTKAGDNLYILDNAGGKIYRQPTAGGNSEVLIEGLINPTALAADANGELLVYSNVEGSVLSLINPASKAISRLPNVTRQNLPVSRQLAVYSTTNSLYSISTGAAEVKQLNRSGRNYNAPTTRLKGDNLSDLRDIEIIDARVSLLAGGEGLIRVGLTNATIEAFTDVEEAVENADVLAADDEYIYIVDNNSKRLLVFTKSRGSQSISDYVAQIPLQDMQGRILDVFVDKAKNAIFLATESRIYLINRSQAII